MNLYYCIILILYYNNSFFVNIEILPFFLANSSDVFVFYGFFMFLSTYIVFIMSTLRIFLNSF